MSYMKYGTFLQLQAINYDNKVINQSTAIKWKLPLISYCHLIVKVSTIERLLYLLSCGWEFIFWYLESCEVLSDMYTNWILKMIIKHGSWLSFSCWQALYETERITCFKWVLLIQSCPAHLIFLLDKQDWNWERQLDRSSFISIYLK